MCNSLPFWSFGFWKHCYTLLNILITFGLVYCNTPITDLICALFGPYAAMFVTRIYPGKSLKVSFVSPGKPWNLFFASPGKSWKTVPYCLYELWTSRCFCLNSLQYEWLCLCYLAFKLPCIKKVILIFWREFSMKMMMMISMTVVVTTFSLVNYCDWQLLFSYQYCDRYLPF